MPLEDVSVDAGGLQGNGGDATQAQPLDQLPQSRRVGGELPQGSEP